MSLGGQNPPRVGVFTPKILMTIFVGKVVQMDVLFEMDGSCQASTTPLHGDFPMHCRRYIFTPNFKQAIRRVFFLQKHSSIEIEKKSSGFLEVCVLSSTKARLNLGRKEATEPPRCSTKNNGRKRRKKV